MSPELQAKITIWRKRALEGSLSREEMAEAIQALREGRKSAAVSSAPARRAAAKAAIPNADDLLRELGVDL